MSDRRLIDVDFLEPPQRRSARLLEVIAVFFVGRRPDAAERTILWPASRGSMHPLHRLKPPAPITVRDLVDEHDGAFKILDLRDDRLEAFLEIAAITCSARSVAHI